MSAQPISNLSIPDRLGLTTDQFRLVLKQFGCAFRVALICEVQSFNPGPPATVTVQPVTMEIMNQNVSGNPVATNTALPLLVDVPVVTLGGGDFVVTMPIQQGDECVVLFSDMDFDAWFQSGGTGNAQVAKDRHDLWDGIAIVGPRSTPNGIEDYNTSGAELRSLDGTVKVTATPGNLNMLAGGNYINISSTGIYLYGPVIIDSTASIDGISFTTHTHTGVTTGSGDTGPPA